MAVTLADADRAVAAAEAAGVVLQVATWWPTAPSAG